MAVRAPEGKTILVIEDEGIVAKDLQRTLMDLGYSVPGTAASAADAIRLADERRPDLVMMDIRIAGDQDGIQAAEALRSRFDVPIVYVTAYADPATLARATTTLPHGYLIKPVQLDELRATVALVLQRHEAERRLRERPQFLSSTLRTTLETIRAAAADAARAVQGYRAALLGDTGGEGTRGCPDEVSGALDEIRDAADRIGRALAELQLPPDP